MTWPLMTREEMHEFGVRAILPYLEKEGFAVELVNDDLSKEPQIAGTRWGKPAFISVRTECYPAKGTMTEHEHFEIVDWANSKRGTAFFASVGIMCTAYPDGSEVLKDEDMRLPIRHGAFWVSYEGLLVMTTSDRVRIW